MMKCAVQVEMWFTDCWVFIVLKNVYCIYVGTNSVVKKGVREANIFLKYL